VDQLGGVGTVVLVGLALLPTLLVPAKLYLDARRVHQQLAELREHLERIGPGADHGLDHAWSGAPPPGHLATWGGAPTPQGLEP
jgi:hypothetical protein